MKLLFFIFLLIIRNTISSRILFIWTFPAKSHVIIAQGLSTVLAEKGHNVTFVSAFPLSEPVANHREIQLPIDETLTEIIEEIVKNPKRFFLWSLPKLLKILVNSAQNLLDMPEFKKLMSDEKFDLVIVGISDKYLLGVADHFKCPSIVFGISHPGTVLNILIGNPMEIHAVPHFYTTSKKMQFCDRLKNFVWYSLDLLWNAFSQSQQKKIYNRNFPPDKYRSYDQSVKNVSMVFINNHFTQSGIRPNVPAYVEIGGIHIKDTLNNLTEELQTFIDGGKDGAILFSLGSNAKTSFLPREKIEILLKAFSKLKQRVIMKWESDTLEGKPENVLIGKWLPQDSILAHPNIKLFITHGGLGSIVESKYHGVPIIGMPIFADQHGNIESAVKDGWGLKVDFINLKEDELSEAIHKMLTNDKYSATVKQIAKLYKDRPMNARETAVYWVEYVIRHHGAPHMRYPGVDMNLIQRTSLDVIAFLIFISCITLKIFIMITKFLLRKICNNKRKVQDEKKSN